MTFMLDFIRVWILVPAAISYKYLSYSMTFSFNIVSYVLKFIKTLERY